MTAENNSLNRKLRVEGGLEKTILMRNYKISMKQEYTININYS